MATESKNRVWNWFDERYQLNDIVSFMKKKTVPTEGHSTVWYYLGGLTLFFFTVQIMTGILLLMYYQPGENTSYESMRYLVGKVTFGWMIRSIHCWSAHLMIVTLMLHMWSVFFTKTYRKPRELTWVTGFVLFSLALGFGFSGYLLPWNELAYFATAVGTESVKSVPVVGQWILEVLRGGKEVTINTLYRFYALHVCVLPIMTMAVIAVHVIFVQKQGMAKPLGSHGEGKKKGMKFFPDFAVRDLLLWVVAFNVLLLLAVFLPFGLGIPGFEWDLGKKADVLKAAYPGIKPEWYFLWVFQLLKEFPAHIMGMEGPQACMAVISVLMGSWVAIPFLDRSAREGKKSPAFTDFGVAVLFFLLFLMLKAWDVGVHVPHGKAPSPPMEAAIGIATASITLLVGAVVFLFRRIRYKHNYFFISTIALLLAVGHGILGFKYLHVGAVCAVLFFGVLAFTWHSARKGGGK